MSCLDAETIIAMIAGRLAAGDRASVEAHIDHCASCRRWLAEAARQQRRATTGEPAPVAATTIDPGSAGPRSHVMLNPGAQVGRYVVMDLLGVGGMGAVYSASDPQLGRIVALKVVRTSAEQRAQRLIREAQAMARVSHANVVPIYDAGQDGSIVFIAMKRIEGPALRDYLATRSLSPRDRLRLLCDAGRGLAAAHAVGIVHRDFKPDNILVEADGTAKVGDFGLAAVGGDDDRGDDPDGSPTSPLTVDGTIVGTPAYMAPECRHGERADARSDQYSFAVSVAEAVGPRPGRRIRRALERARAIDPHRRFDSIVDVISALERRPRLVPIAIALTLAGAVTAIAVMTNDPDVAVACDQEPVRQLDAVLGPVTRTMLTAHATALSPEHARDVTLSLGRVDRYAARWVAMSQATCRATEVTGEQPRAIHAERVACLDERLDELGVVSRSLLALDDAHAEAVSRLGDILGDLDQCTRPRPPAAISERSLRRQLVEARALAEVADVDRARPIINTVLAAARADGLAAVEGEAVLSRASLVAQTDPAAATDGYHTALAIAERTGDEDLRVEVLIRLLAGAAIDRSRASEVELLARLIDDGIAELAGPQRLRRSRVADSLALYYLEKQDFGAAARSARLATQLLGDELGPGDAYTIAARRTEASVYAHQGRFADALAITDANIDAIRRAYGEVSPQLAFELHNKGSELYFAHRDDEALAVDRRALELSEKLYGPDHPWVIRALREIGFLELAANPRAAIEPFSRAIASVDKTGHANPDLPVLLVGLGRAQLASGDPAAATATLERGLASWPREEVGTHQKPAGKLALAKALWASGGDHVRARRLAEEAHAEYISARGHWLDKAREVATWLTTHR